jgi:nitrogen fixation protein NifB
VFRRDRLGPVGRALDVADVLRYVGAARRTLRGAVVVVIEGPGDPLASPATVLRALSLLEEHDPEVKTGLVIDGPLLCEYADELADLGLHHLVLRMDAATVKTARRVYGRVHYRGETLTGVDAGRLVLEEGRRAVRLAARRGLAVAVRFTAIPTVNVRDLGAVASFGAWEGVERVEVVPHAPVPGAPLERAGTPTPSELAACRDVVAAAYRAAGEDGVERAPGALAWLDAGRVRDVPLSSLEHVDALSLLPDPEEEARPAAILPPRRAQMVAVASTDGERVDRPLADAGQVRVYAVQNDGIRWLGTRSLSSASGRRRDGVGDAQEFLRAVAGCRAVVATRFTPRASTLLDAVGIASYVAGGPVEEVLDRIARGTVARAADARAGV